MLRLTSKPSFFLLFFFSFNFFLYSTSALIFSFPFNPSDGVEIFEMMNQHDEEQYMKTWKSVMEENGKQGNTTLVLAQERTQRKDIFNHFKRYNGGWNITNPDYISSVVSTSVLFFLVAAAAWFVIFGVVLLLMCACCCCCPREPFACSKSACAVSFIFLFICTIAAICGCIVLYYSQQEFHGSTTNTLDYVVSRAELTAENLKNVSNYFDSAKEIAFKLGLPSNVDKDIDVVKKKISSAASNLSIKTQNSSQILHHGIDGMRLALIIVAAVMLFVAIFGFLFSILGLHCLIYSVVVVGWILVAGTFLLCGAFLFLHNVIGDTCVAMDEWVLNPTAHTALDEILPCVEKATTMETILETKIVTHLLVHSVDEVISNVLNANIIPYNQSGPLTPLLCNPFNTNYTTRHCAAEEVALENASEVWKNYICEVSSKGNCTSVGRMTPFWYTQFTAAANVTYGLYHYGPFLVDLADCNFVRETFVEISNIYCPNLQRYTQWIYRVFILLSVALMLSLILWVMYGRQ